MSHLADPFLAYTYKLPVMKQTTYLSLFDFWSESARQQVLLKHIACVYAFVFRYVWMDRQAEKLFLNYGYNGPALKFRFNMNLFL